MEKEKLRSSEFANEALKDAGAMAKEKLRSSDFANEALKKAGAQPPVSKNETSPQLFIFSKLVILNV